MYWRLVLVAYILTIALVIYSYVFFSIKVIIISVLSMLLCFEWNNKKKANRIREIQFIGSAWRIMTDSDTLQLYNEAHILISNPLFQLIQFINIKQKKVVVLFQDQLTERELRLLQLKITQN